MRVFGPPDSSLFKVKDGRFPHLLTQAAKPKTPSKPKLAWMMLAGSGMA